ncbi:ABC transporter ATP-binding protein [Streptomyces sp. NPDC097640]|uniref:ABC transporter ATP-binding protein n=1 Tax=Streptomyces sp. NPDC097640 TaxID=3157229 RepID=UPI003320247B
MAAVSIRGLTKRYGDHTVVDGLDLDIADGEFLTLLGPSGCGKTTTLRCLAGLEKPDAGEIRIDGRVVVDSRGTFVPPEKRDLGMVFQSYALWPHMNVHANVAYPLRMRRTPRAQIAERVTEALRTVGLEKLAHRPVGALSGGQQQRVALARALVARPGLVLFDEPLSNLDARLRATMREQLQLLRQTVPATSVYVTHDQVEALTLADRIVVMHDGRVQQTGTPEQIYSDPANRFVADFVGFENLLPATVLGSTDQALLVELDGFPEPLPARPTGPAPAVGEPVTVAARANCFLLADADGTSGISARVLTATYLGDQAEYVLRVHAHTLRVRTPAPVRARAGREVTLIAQPGALLALADETFPLQPVS